MEFEELKARIAQAEGGNPWEDAAGRLVALKFPPPHIIRLRNPTCTVPGRRITADFGMYLDGRLVAVVEVGDLSIAGKMELWEQALPEGTQILWITKADLLLLASPAHARFRFTVEPDEAREVLTERLRAQEEHVALLRQHLREERALAFRLDRCLQDARKGLAAVAGSIRRARKIRDGLFRSMADEWLSHPRGLPIDESRYSANGTAEPEKQDPDG